MDKISVDYIKKCDKKIIDNYIFSLYLSKIKKLSYVYCFLFKREEDLFLLTDNAEIFYNLKIDNVEKLFFAENTIKTTKDVILGEKTKISYLDYDYAEQVVKIISNTKKEDEFIHLNKLFSMCSKYKPLLICFLKEKSDYSIHINQVKNSNCNQEYSLPSYCFDLKNIFIQHNIYKLDNWDIFGKFNNDNIVFLNFKIPKCYCGDVILLNEKDYLNIK